MKNRIFLVGPPGVGVSYVASLVKQRFENSAASVDLRELAAQKRSKDRQFDMAHHDPRKPLPGEVACDLILNSLNEVDPECDIIFDGFLETADQVAAAGAHGLMGTGSMIIVMLAKIETCESRNRLRPPAKALNRRSLSDIYMRFCRDLPDVEEAVFKCQGSKSFHLDAECIPKAIYHDPRLIVQAQQDVNSVLRDRVVPRVAHYIRMLRDVWVDKPGSTHPFQLHSVPALA